LIHNYAISSVRNNHFCKSTFLAVGPQAPVEIVDTTHIPPDHWRAQLPHEVGDA
jgi:hypothetical protein